MGRPERPLDPTEGPVQRFAWELRRLREKAGSPSYRELSRKAHFSSTALSEAAGGSQLPTLAVTLGYVEACEGDTSFWEQQWREVAASLLTPEPVRLHRFPTGLRDAQVHLEMLDVLGKASAATDGHVAIEEPGPLRTELVWDGRSIRNTLLILGALTARFGEGAVPMPGGCAIGERKIDLHEHLLREMGARVWFEGDVLRAEGRCVHVATSSFVGRVLAT